MTGRHDPDRFRRVDALFDAALDIAPADRPAFLDNMCGGDVALRTEVESLLDSIDTAESHFGERVGDYAAALLAGMPDLHDAALEPGTVLGAWRVEREIGRGGMGTVYLASRADGAFERSAAIKVVKRGMDSTEIVRRFHAERRILASLDHPGIARLLDAGIAPDGRPFLVMEHVEGEPIDRWCEANGLGVRSRVDLFRRVCDAVHEAHRRLIVHRDVKPANVLITAEGTPKLLDFGIAKLLEIDDVDATIAHSRLLTPAYAAPEQVSGDAITTATDVYALGVLLHELLTGARPTSAGTVLPGLPRDLAVIIGRATAAEPERRYGSALQLAEDLDRWLRALPVLARRDTLAYRTSRFVRRNRIAVAAAATAMLLLLAFTAVVTAAQRRTADALRQAETERDTAEEVAALLEGIFSAGDPQAVRRERLDTLRVAALLDRSAVRVREELADRPHVQARLMRALGDAYRGMGLYDAAAPLLRDAAVALRSSTDSVALAGALNAMGLLELARGRSSDAEPWLREALAVQRTLPADDPADLVRILSNLAASRQDQNASDQALALYDEAEQVIMSSAIPDTGLLTIVLNGRAHMAQRAGDFAGAATAAERIMAIDRVRLGPEHPRIGINLVNIALMKERLGAVSAADSILTEGVDMLGRTLGTDHVVYAGALASLANLRARNGRRAEARPMFETAIAVMRSAIGPSRDLAITLSQYADMLADDGLGAEAMAAVNETIEMERRVAGPDHPDVGVSTTQLARIGCFHGDIDGALPRFDRALDILRASLPPSHPRIVDAQRSLGACLAEHQRFVEAERVLLAAFASLRGDTSDDSVPPAARPIAQELAELYDAWSRTDDAASWRAALADSITR